MQDNYHSKVAMGWISQLIVILIVLVFAIYQSVYDDDNFAALLADPGSEGFTLLVVITATYALMPYVVYIIQSTKVRFLRWIPVAVAALNLLFFFLHHWKHIMNGTRTNLMSHTLDIVLHIIGVWILVYSIRWARSKIA